MSDSRKGKSIWKKFEKPKGDAKVENDGKLFFRINKKTGRPETNYLEWERSWKNVKILKYSSRFANELRTGVRENPTVEEILEANVTLPDLDATREFWIPTVEQTAALTAIENAAARAAAENAMFVAWRRAILEENARRKAMNEVAKTRIALEVKDLKERSDTISKIMGAVLEDIIQSGRAPGSQISSHGHMSRAVSEPEACFHSPTLCGGGAPARATIYVNHELDSIEYQGIFIP